jgi:glycosyltransferase involved in cell wall biosynthesis
MIGTWHNKVDIYIALTDFARQKFIQAGFPAEKIVVKPNFVFENTDSEGEGTAGESRKGGLYVGRLSHEKGIDLLLKAWERLGEDAPLTIIGDGPMSDMVVRAVKKMPWVRWLGQKESGEAIRLMGVAAFFILPSVCYEGMPRTIVEAFMQGTAPVTFKLGAMGSMIENGRTGVLCEPGSPDDLAVKVKWAFEHPEEMVRMGRTARSEYEKKYTAERNYEMLVNIYEKAVSHARSEKMTESCKC